MKLLSGADTAGLKQIESSPLMVPSWMASMISSAGMPLPGISVSSTLPHPGDCGPVLGVGDVAVAGELVALVAVLPTALAVALPGDRRHAAARLAELARGQPEVDGGEHVVDALGLLLDAAGVQHHPGGRGAPQLGRLLDAGGGDAGDVGRPLRRHVGHGRGGLVEVDGVGVDELVVEPVVADQLVQHRSEQGRVAARPDRQEQVGGAGEGHDPRVLDDEPGAAVPGPPDVAGGDREGLGHVRAGHPDHVGERDVAPRVRRPVDHRAPSCCRRRPTPCRSGRCSRGWRCGGRAGRTCRPGSSSRWSARRPTTWRRRRRRRSAWMRWISSTTRFRALVPADLPEPARG